MKYLYVILFFFSLQSFALDNLSSHYQNYFIIGKDDLKFQLSLKYKLTAEAPIYLGMTQVMFWNIYEESKPFEDINFQPEFFWRMLDNLHSNQTFDIGMAHHSNGKNQLDSRSFDKFFLRLNLETTLNRHKLGANLTTQHIFNKDPQNVDISDYYGHLNLSFFINRLIDINQHILDFNLDLRPGGVLKFNRGGALLGFSYHQDPSLNFGSYLQIFDGFGENLLKYNQQSTIYRVGIILGILVKLSIYLLSS